MNSISYWMALDQAHGIGPAHMKEIFDALAGPGLDIADLFDLTEDEIAVEFSFNKKTAESIVKSKSLLPQIEEDYFSLIDMGYEVIPFFAESYPHRLKEHLGNSMPSLLYIFGNKSLVNLRGVAVLGDKFVSPKGSEIAYTAARELSHHKLTTISGYAMGVDMIAHRSAIETGGTTVAVLPYGILKFRPHDSILNILDPERFCAVSSFYPTIEANKFNAFIRNKIACALSQAVYIVESPLEGGIFEAAKSAQKLGIPLFTTQYAQYPENATGNEKIISEMNGIPVKGKYVNELLVPNMEKIIGMAKFG